MRKERKTVSFLYSSNIHSFIVLFCAVQYYVLVFILLNHRALVRVSTRFLGFPIREPGL